ncbi:hypothetical protein OIV83_004257 [Microbotryomycetes sp. JL201]|nr:hypothetical protein OIV83_004257 [Microbotryomycetes sp. JL201]
MARVTVRAVTVAAALIITICFFGFLRLTRPTASSGRATVFVVTPTYDRLTRFATLVSLGQALTLAFAAAHTNILWLVIEDANELDPAVTQLLSDFQIPHKYMACRASRQGEHRGIEQRNFALDFIQKYNKAGVIYFADDDNTIQSALIETLATIPPSSFTIFPVGNLGYFGFEGPVIVDHVDGDEDEGVRISHWCCDLCRRRWNIDMAGFAFHSSVLKGAPPPHIRFSHQSETGFLETDMLSLIERTGARFVLSKHLLETVHVWHDSPKQSAVAAYYDADWVTSAILARKPASSLQVVRGFASAEDNLPSATWIA